ncbi:hypothetical protein [Legionella hackeliae]|uniref:Uncharacterized protein n=1 Tax=Legionella hackeliae TaxID=449 RepID=A0A0A8UP03_LEGHA|nr:hypothetical protein [Legionella hackeliae]KTD13874.1 hypothetical protein Lhac_0718 [Legionella hackeliae]CEK10575.1 protein of unknown function [Legionella hackeliae]STX47315.1 Uncharacterised protein [Legionella hackeliae]
MSYKGIQILLKESKENNPPPDAWLQSTKNEVANFKQSWREERKKQVHYELYKDNTLDKTLFMKLVNNLSSKLSERQSNKLKKIWNDKTVSLDNMVNNVLDFATKVGYFDDPFIKNMNPFLKIFPNDQELFNYLRSPQQYITDNKLTFYQQQILELVTKAPSFRYLSIGQYLNGQVESELTGIMKELHLESYGCRDALSFEDLINPYVKDKVVQDSKKEHYGPQIMGMGGALESYDRRLITSTAKKVKSMKMGECHTLAQLGAEHLLSKIESGLLAGASIKMVTHEDNRGSHTFLLLNHTGDLSDLSKCIIVDPWAYSMGYTDTQGIFTIDNYPFPGMTTKLKCCYDSWDDNVHLSRKYNREIGPQSQTNVEEEKMKINPEDAKGFIEYLYGAARNLIKDESKETLLKEILRDLHYDDIPPSQAVKIATDIYFAGSVEGDSKAGYSWSKGDNFTTQVFGSNDEAYLKFFEEAFNRYPTIKSYWESHLQSVGGDNAPIEHLDSNAILEIGEHLSNDNTLEREYVPKNPDVVFSL